MSPDVEVTLGVEVALDRGHTSVVAACEQGDNVLLELVRYAPGADTADVVAGVAGELYVVGLALNSTSASMTLARPLRDHKLEPTLLSGSDVACAHGAFLDLHRAERLRLVEHAALVDALKAADQRARGERYVVDRRGTLVDLSPLLAAELAVWCLRNLPAPLPTPDIF
jgi:hypothetical protein